MLRGSSSVASERAGDQKPPGIRSGGGGSALFSLFRSYVAARSSVFGGHDRVDTLETHM